MFRLLLFIAIILLIEFYSFKGLLSITQSIGSPWRKISLWSFWIITTLCWGLLFYMMSRRNDFALSYRDYGLFNFVIGFFIIVVVSKILFGSFHLLNDLSNLVKYTIVSLRQKPEAAPHEAMTRLQFFNQTGLALSTIWIGAGIYGVTKGKFSYRVLSEKLHFTNLPSAFDGLRIVQISDLHIGSFNQQFDNVQEGFDLVNSLDADYIFFTGDLVNNFASEAEPWIERLQGLKARYGKFSILGNHDYGDYALAQFPEERAKSFNRLIEIHKEAGFTLLRDEHVTLEREGQTIELLGCENWGIGFHQHGDLSKAIAGTADDDFKILLSHDPTHWQTKVVGEAPPQRPDREPIEAENNNIALTLSGHTHGAQFGVELPWLGIKFSPVSLRYKRWGGLYEKHGKYLYINRGFGYLAFPGRIGMPPEITLLELHTAKSA
jgi:predicted MPP superfamily phosphohydrolase